MSNVVDVATFNNHSIARYSNGDLWVTGDNSRGQLGLRDVRPIRDPLSQRKPWIKPKLIPWGIPTTVWGWVKVMTGLTVELEIGKIAAGNMNSLVIMADRSLCAVGFNGSGQLGLGDDLDRREWVQTATDVRQVAAGYGHSLVLKNDGSLWGAGNNEYGQIGGGSAECKVLDWRLSLTGVIGIACGLDHSLAIRQDGCLWVTGCNGNGQLGLGDTNHRYTWVKTMDSVSMSSNSNLMICGGHRHSLVCRADGTLWGTGANNDGTLGLGDYDDRNQWACSSLKRVCGVSAGSRYSLAIVHDLGYWGNRLYATGTPNVGALGCLIGSLSSWSGTGKRLHHAVADACTLALCQDGLYACGGNYSGQCGVPFDPNNPGQELFGWYNTLEAGL